MRPIVLRKTMGFFYFVAETGMIRRGLSPGITPNRPSSADA